MVTTNPAVGPDLPLVLRLSHALKTSPCPPRPIPSGSCWWSAPTTRFSALQIGMSDKSILRDFHPDAEDLYNVTMDLATVCNDLRDRNRRMPRRVRNPQSHALCGLYVFLLQSCIRRPVCKLWVGSRGFWNLAYPVPSSHVDDTLTCQVCPG